MQISKLFTWEVLENKHNWHFRSTALYENNVLPSSLWQSRMHFSTSFLTEAVTPAINARTYSAVPGIACVAYGILCHWLSPSLSLFLVSHQLFGTQQGMSLHREVCCESLKASALQVPIMLPLENTKGNNVIIHLDLKLYGKASKSNGSTG